MRAIPRIYLQHPLRERFHALHRNIPPSCAEIHGGKRDGAAVVSIIDSCVFLPVYFPSCVRVPDGSCMFVTLLRLILAVFIPHTHILHTPRQALGRRRYGVSGHRRVHEHDDAPDDEWSRRGYPRARAEASAAQGLQGSGRGRLWNPRRDGDHRFAQEVGLDAYAVRNSKTGERFSLPDGCFERCRVLRGNTGAVSFYACCCTCELSVLVVLVHMLRLDTRLLMMLCFATLITSTQSAVQNLTALYKR